MMYKQIECPICGNVTTAKSIDEPQKCKWCRRLFKVNITQGRKGRYNWSAEPVDFGDKVEDDKPKARIKTLNDYMYKDIYGKSNK